MTKLHGLRGAAAALLCIGIGGCGGSDTITTPRTPPPPTPPPPTVAVQENWDLDVDFAFGWYFNISSTGTIEATADYTFADTTLVVYIASGECTGEMWVADQCEYVASSFDGPKPRMVSATRQPAGRYTVIVWNLGPQSESGVIQVVFTAQPGAASRTGGSDLSSLRPWPAPAQKF